MKKNGIFSVLLTVIVLATLSVPVAAVVCVELTATGGCDTVHLSWTDTGADHYNVYRGTTSGGPYVMIGSVTTNSYDDSAAITGTTYYYVVREGDTTGSELCQSNEISASIASCVPEFPTLALPVMIIIGFLGAVLFIGRTRNN